MRSQLLYLAFTGLLFLLLPRVEATCDDTTLKSNCASEADAATQPLQTNDQKCRNLALYKACLERDASCSDASGQTTAKEAPLNNPVCVGATCSGAQCVGSNQECSTTCKCMPAYKLSEGICVGKMVNDTCTEGSDATCPSSMTCAGTGNDAKCACKASYKESNSTCQEKMINDACTAGDATTCPDSMSCSGTGADAKCACKLGYKESNSTCVAKMINDACNTSVSGDCGAKMDCTNSTCTCKSGEGDNGQGMCAATCAPGFKGTVDTACTAKAINDSCSTTTAGDCGENMDCTASKCDCKGSLGNDGRGMCASSCASDYKGAVNNCTRKVPGDACTAGHNQTCPASAYCSAQGVCACPSPQKDDGMGVCAVNCTDGYGDDGRGRCATACAMGFKGDVGNCTEKLVGDSCTAGDDSTCGSNQRCLGQAGNASCACMPSYISGDNNICVVKKPGDQCTSGVDATCGPNQECEKGKCECKDKYKFIVSAGVCTGSAAGLLLSLSLHFLPLAAVLGITRWL